MEWRGAMELDALVHHYFGTADLAELSPEAAAHGREALAVDFGVEQEPGRKFALWVLMDALGIAPLPAAAFPKHPELRQAADHYLTASERLLPDH
ncbi:MAG TPA: hypothetical protein VE567_04560 [Sphingomonas sp.]|nr:hypothetical protein [Sphingomonas sp.]